MFLLLTRLSLTILFSSLLSSRRIQLNRMQKFSNHLLDLHLLCPRLANSRRSACRLFTRPSNSSTNTWRQNTWTDRHYNSLSFNYKMTLPHCAICFFPQLKQSPTRISPLKTSLPVLYLTLTLTLTLLHPSSTGGPQLHRSTTLGAVGPPRAKTNNSANADVQPTLNTEEAPLTTVQNLASRFSKLEKLFTD